MEHILEADKTDYDTSVFNLDDNQSAFKCSENWIEYIEEMYPKIGLSFKEKLKDGFTENDIIKFVYESKLMDFNKIKALVNNWIQQKSNKSVLKSELYRSKGNQYYNANKLKDSVFCYTNSILHAPAKTVYLALAYANRSAVAFQNGDYERCIADIKRCLNNPYPSDLKHKVFFRLANCYCNTGLFDDAQQAVENTKEWLVEATVSTIKKGQLEKSLAELQCKIDDKKELNVTLKSDMTIPELAYGKNPKFLYASNAVELRNSPINGRYVTAVENIKKGDILFAEEPYATTLIDKNAFVCFECGVNCDKIAIPCTKCINSYYCSEKCQKSAWELYHRWECTGLLSSLMDHVGLGHLALKIVLKGAHINFSDKQENEDTFGSTGNNYASVFSLVPNINKMTLDDVVCYSLTAVMLTIYLEQKTGFLQWYLNKCQMEINTLKQYISSLLLRHICQLQCNANIIQIKTDDIESAPKLCTAICPSISMMNHSCDTNIFSDFFQNQIIVRALRDIKKDEEITNSYGVSYTTESFEGRQSKLLSQYYFVCRCSICSSENLERKYHFELLSSFKCSKCSGRVLSKNMTCFDCQYVLKNKNYSLYYSGLSMEKQGLYLSAYNQLKNCLHENNIKLRELCEELAAHYEKHKHYEESLSYHRRVIAMLKKQCGDGGILVTNQMILTSFLLLKYMQVLEFQHSSKFKNAAIECVAFLKETKERVSYLYGPWNSKFQAVNSNLEKAETLLESYKRKIQNS